MKTRLTILNLIVLFVSFATTSVFGQSTYVWTNQFPQQLNTTTATSGGDIGTATNWNPNGIPIGNIGPDGNGVFGDEIVWDGTTTHDLIMTETGTAVGAGGQNQAAGFGNPTGVRIHLTANQTHSVTVKSPAGVTPATSGWRFQSITIDGPGGSWSFGTNNLGNEHLDIVTGGQPGQIHNFINNSTNPAHIYVDVRWRAGGGGAHTYVFDGTGDWIINHDMIGANNSPNVINHVGSGTLDWTYAKTDSGQNSTLQGPFVFTGGPVIMRNSQSGASLFPTIVQVIQNDASVWTWDGGANSDSFGGTITGAGLFRLITGTLSLGGQNTFTGNIQLNGGTLVANGAENVGVSGPLGVGNVISFNGGALGYGNNTFDYSSRFDAAPGQQYKIDTRGQSVAFSNNLASTGATLTKLGDGTLTLAGTSSYSGLTTVSQGTLALVGPKTGSGNITVADGATLGLTEITGQQVTPATLTLGTGVGASLELDNVTNKTTAPLAAGTVSSAGTTVISLTSDSFSIGKSYPVLSWSSGSAPAVVLGIVDGGGGFLTTNGGNSIVFNCTAVALIWSGANNGTWDTNTTPNNWTQEGSPVVYSDPLQAVFPDTASGATNVTLSGAVKPEALTVNNTTNPYSIASSSGNVLGGNIRFSKKGSGSLTLSGGANTNSGTVTLRGGTVVLSTLANGGSASDIGAASSAGTNLVFNGGTMQYTGAGASIDRLFRVLGNGGTLDVEGSGPLTLNNPGAISHNGRLTLNGNTADTNTLASALIGGGRLVKDGTGTWVMTGTNAYGGGTVVNNGVLQVGAGSGSGSLGSGGIALGTGTTLDFQRTGTLTVGGAISGAGSVVKNGSGTVILANNNTYSGGTTINAGTLQVGNGGSSGELYINGPIVNNTALIFNTAGAHNYTGAGAISGPGSVTVSGGGWIKAIGANSYTGSTVVDGGGTLLPTTFQPCEGNTGGFVSSGVNIINNARLVLIRQDNGFSITTPITSTGNLGPPSFPGVVFVGANNNNVGDVTLLGTNNYGLVATVGLSGTYIGCNRLILGDNSTIRAGEITGNVTFTNNFTTPDDNTRALRFNRPDSFTFSGNIVTNFATPQNNLGIVELFGNGTVTLTGNNTYGGTNNPAFGGTVVNSGFLVIGNGGSSGTVGKGPVTLNNANPLVINRSGTMTAFGPILGGNPNDLLVQGGCTVTINGNSTYTGTNGIVNGTLIVSGTNTASSTYVTAGGLGGSGTFTGPVTLAPGTSFSPGSSIGTPLIDNNFTNDASSFRFDINKLLSPSNTTVKVTGALVRNVTGGTLTVHNLGPQDLVPGDKFYLFALPDGTPRTLPNGNSMTVTGGRATWINNLGGDGSISVATVITTQPTLNWTVGASGTNITFSWTDPYNAFKLQSETNSILANTWFDYPGGGTSPVTVSIAKTNAQVYFRIVSIP